MSMRRSFALALSTTAALSLAGCLPKLTFVPDDARSDAVTDTPRLDAGSNDAGFDADTDAPARDVTTSDVPMPDVPPKMIAFLPFTSMPSSPYEFLFFLSIPEHGCSAGLQGAA